MTVRPTGGLLEQTAPATHVSSQKLRVLLTDYDDAVRWATEPQPRVWTLAVAGPGNLAATRCAARADTRHYVQTPSSTNGSWTRSRVSTRSPASISHWPVRGRRPVRSHPLHKDRLMLVIGGGEDCPVAVAVGRAQTVRELTDPDAIVFRGAQAYTPDPSEPKEPTPRVHFRAHVVEQNASCSEMLVATAAGRRSRPRPQ